ncbi:BACON domain-containing protein [Streptomyces sp. 8N706]|uniref:BACON domain-containing protein n=1 Tax=Streptomyces sp. 8N706 TaxID=3457416 RepID=UPI003FD135A9
MMSSRREKPTHITGALTAQRRARNSAQGSAGSSADGSGRMEATLPTAAQQLPARYEPYVDGLFTYCLSVLCEHDAATVVLGDVLALAEVQDGRRPADDAQYRPWLYALARWACLQRLAEKRRTRGVPPQSPPPPAARRSSVAREPSVRAEPSGARELPGAEEPAATGGACAAGGSAAAAEPSGAGGPGAAVGPSAHARPSGAEEASGGAESAEAAAVRHRRELAALAWPEAAGTTPEQREALELAVRHRLPADEVAAVLGMEPDAARALLSSAVCEVERTRAALVVVERGSCPVVARLTGDHQVLLGTALRRELVRHVDDCSECRRTAERATAGGPWPGSTSSPGSLPVLIAPRAAAYAAMAQARRGGRGRTGPRYDRRGFPMDPKDRVARRRRLRARAVTTAVVATVVAAPVLALWAAYRQAPPTGEGQNTGSVTAAEAGVGGLSGHPYDEAGNSEAGPDPRFSTGSRSPDVSVEVVDGHGERRPGHRADRTPSAGPAGSPGASWSAGSAGRVSGAPGAGRPSSSHGPGRLTVQAQPSGDTTLITLTASGGSAVRWSASADVPWLQLNLTAGLLRPGESVMITVAVDEEREPEGPWTAHVSIDPAGAVVTIEGRGATPEPTPTPTPTPTEPPPTGTPGPSGSSEAPPPSGGGAPSPSG